jgi:hypothetical protein
MRFIKLLFSLSLVMSAHAGEKAIYVGEGRYACGVDSVDCAVLKQRNQEQTRRTQERDKEDQRNEQVDRQEREYKREYESRKY